MERRQHKRSKSPQLLPVLNVISGEQLGMLVELSFGGLQIMTTSDLLIDAIYHLQIVFPQPEGPSEKIEFSAEVEWFDSRKQNGVCWAGFQIINISDYELERVGRLVNLWSIAQNNASTQDKKVSAN
ncbi:MAG: PilZ domain-containing protein [Methylococcales bacterium]